MSEISETVDIPKARRRRRADAERSVNAIVEAAVRVLGERPDASVEDIADAAGVTRQTVYAHFTSRDALVHLVVDRVTAEVVAAMDAADLDERPPVEAVVEFLRAGWRTFERSPLLLHAVATAAPVTPEADRGRHEPIVDRLERLIRRGQRRGDFDRAFPASWLVAAVIGLAHAAGEEVGAGRMKADDAGAALERSVLRLVCAG